MQEPRAIEAWKYFRKAITLLDLYVKQASLFFWSFLSLEYQSRHLQLCCTMSMFNRISKFLVRWTEEMSLQISEMFYFLLRAFLLARKKVITSKLKKGIRSATEMLK